MRVAAVILWLSAAAAAQTVDGVVTNSVTSAPVRKARIELISAATSYVAVSDGSGRFHLEHVAPGEYTASVTCQGFSPGDRPVRVPDATTVTIPLAPYGVIAGRVFDEAGDALPGRAVVALDRNYARAASPLSVAGTASTDDRGEYRLFDLRPGHYYVLLTAGPPAAPSTQVFYPGAIDFSQASAVDVLPGAEVVGIDLPVRRTPGFRLRGSALDAATGEPLNGVLTVEYCGTGLRVPIMKSLGSDGTFDLPNVPPATYCLSVDSTRGSREVFAGGSVTVSGRDVEGVKLLGQPPVEIQGRIAMEGSDAASPLNVHLAFDCVDRARTMADVYAKRDGQFTLRLPPLVYRLMVSGAPAGTYVKSIRLGEQDASDGVIPVTPGAGPLVVVLASGAAELRGSVQTRAGGPAAGALVVIAATGNRAGRMDLFRNTEADFDGSFRLPDLAPGDYRIFAWEHGVTALALAPQFREGLAAESTTISLRKGGSETVSLGPVTAEAIRRARAALQ